MEAEANEEAEAEAAANEEAESRLDSTALLLWHSLIATKLRPSMDFHAALANLGSVESKDLKEAVERGVDKVRLQSGRLRRMAGVRLTRREIAWMDSTKRKRKKKMSKHKLKKRRRLERALRRQQSK